MGSESEAQCEQHIAKIVELTMAERYQESRWEIALAHFQQLHDPVCNSEPRQTAWLTSLTRRE